MLSHYATTVVGKGWPLTFWVTFIYKVWHFWTNTLKWQSFGFLRLVTRMPLGALCQGLIFTFRALCHCYILPGCLPHTACDAGTLDTILPQSFPGMSLGQARVWLRHCQPICNRAGFITLTVSAHLAGLSPPIISHKYPIPISPLCFTSHICVCPNFSHGEHQCASRCWCSPTWHNYREAGVCCHVCLPCNTQVQSHLLST